jgi:hypothetical protein
MGILIVGGLLSVLQAANKDGVIKDFKSIDEEEDGSIFEPLEPPVLHEQGNNHSPRFPSPVNLRTEDSPEPQADWNPLNFEWPKIFDFIPPRQFWWPNLEDPSTSLVRPGDPTPPVHSVEEGKSASVASSSRYSKKPALEAERNSDEGP